MQLYIDKLGKVAVTVEKGYWNITKEYDKLTIVQAQQGEYKTYISRKPVPAGAELTNRDYWIPFSSLKEEIVLDYNTFVNLWTNNLANTNKRIDNFQIRYDKDLEEIYKAITSVIVGGVALKQSFGDSEEFGISQKVISERFDNIQDQIDKLHPGTLGIVMSVSPNIIYDNSESNVTITARKSDNTICESIKIFKGEDIIAEGENIFELETTAIVNETTTFDAQAIQLGLSYEGNIKVTGVKPYYAGSGLDYADIVSETYQQPIKANASGTYNINVATNGDYIFFVVPDAMSINRATMSGFNFPLQAPQNVEIEGVEYKYYQSANTYDAGTLTIVIS